MNERLRIYENLRSVSYAPFYLAVATEAFALHGLDVEVTLSADPTETAAGLLAGRVDVSWGGPMRVMLHHDRDPECPLVCFCNVVGPEPFCLVGAGPAPDFHLEDLLGQRIGITSEVPTPWLTLQEDLRRCGIDPDALERAPPRTMAENVAALERAEVDVIQVMEPHTGAALESAHGHLWHSFASRGDIGFTSFYTTRAFIEARGSDCRILARTLAGAIARIYADDSIATAGRIGSYFPALTPATLARCIDRYRAAGIWSRHTSLGAAAFVRLKGALLSGGFITRDVPYERAVDDRFALAIAR